MNILICKQGLFGGTDKLLDRLYEWAQDYYEIDLFDSNNLEQIQKKEYDLAICPSSQLGDIYYLCNRGGKVKRVLVWIMGMGAFSDSYYNSSAQSIMDRLLRMVYKEEARKTLLWLINNNAIVFTDTVGIYNSLKSSSLNYDPKIESNIVPIAISVPKENQWKKVKHTQKKVIKISWIGRVSSDFKEIPIRHLIKDLDEWNADNRFEIKLTVVGDGDARDRIKKEASNVQYEVEFIDNIAYAELGSYIEKDVDLLVAMGTSALDGAKIGCPTVIITPVKPTDPERVDYRWIFESKGFSLGEYPNVDIETNQVRNKLDTIMNRYFSDDLLSDTCYEYTKSFSIDKVFSELMNRELPSFIDGEMVKHLKKYYYLKKCKKIIKCLLKQ